MRSMLRRAEARMAEQELGMQRMVSQFEGALHTLQQLESQYDALAAEASSAEQLRAFRIQQLEAENEVLRATRSALQQERDSTADGLGQQLAEVHKQLAEAKQRYHRAMMDNADLTESLGSLKKEAQELRGRCQQLEQECQQAREVHSAVQAALDRERSTNGRTHALLETSKVQLDAVRRDLSAQQDEHAALREAAALLEARQSDSTHALEAAQAKLAAAEERARLLAEQVEQERELHAQLLSSREAEVEVRWARALQAADDERSQLQQTLDLANKQLHQAHRDIETLRLQIQHLRLIATAPSATESHLLHSGKVWGAPGGAAVTADDHGPLNGIAADLDASSRDVFADLPDCPAEPSSTCPRGPYHRQHVNNLAGTADGGRLRVARAASGLSALEVRNNV